MGKGPTSNLFPDVQPWNVEAARQYGKIRTSLEKRGKPIGNMDLLIAAHALSQQCILVSNNLREFSRVRGLKCESWVQAAAE